eukprot:2356366-Rhodomonas_salina.1
MSHSIHLLQLSSTGIVYSATVCLLTLYGAVHTILQSMCRYCVWYNLAYGAMTYAGLMECMVGCQGRTQPSLGWLLLCEADIIQLDVMEVEL